jgi:hypothetical protein
MMDDHEILKNIDLDIENLIQFRYIVQIPK